MSDELLINVTPGETRAAILRSGAVTELFIERQGRESLVGNIYRGRVERVIDGMNAAFVDIGTGRSGFLSADAAREPHDEGTQVARIGALLTEGAAVTVQVVKDAIGSKGVQLTRRLSLPGSFLVLTPTQDRISVSRQITDEAEQERLAGLIRAMAEPGEGFILRTAAEGASEADIARDAEALRAEWASIEALRDQSSGPAALRADLGPLERVLRDHAGPSMAAVRIDSDAGMAAARRFCARNLPAVAGRLVRYEGAHSLFEEFGVEAEIERALSPRIGLQSGGGIVIESTEALTAIDVNSGGLVDAGSQDETSRRTNVEAAREIARQVRLRNIGGLIVVDFIHMDDDGSWDEVIEVLQAGFAGDRNSLRIMGRTAAGLVEMTRRRQRQSLAQLMRAPCPECGGGGNVGRPESIASEILRALPRHAGHAPAGPLTVSASEEVVQALAAAGGGEALAETSRALGREVALRGEPGYARERFEVFVER